MPNCQLPTKFGQVTLVKDLADEPHARQVVEALAVSRTDPRRLLPAMLQGIERKKRQSGRLRGLRRSRDNATRLARLHACASRAACSAVKLRFTASPMLR